MLPSRTRVHGVEINLRIGSAPERLLQRMQSVQAERAYFCPAVASGPVDGDFVDADQWKSLDFTPSLMIIELKSVIRMAITCTTLSARSTYPSACTNVECLAALR